MRIWAVWLEPSLPPTHTHTSVFPSINPKLIWRFALKYNSYYTWLTYIFTWRQNIIGECIANHNLIFYKFSVILPFHLNIFIIAKKFALKVSKILTCYFAVWGFSTHESSDISVRKFSIEVYKLLTYNLTRRQIYHNWKKFSMQKP